MAVFLVVFIHHNAGGRLGFRVCHAAEMNVQAVPRQAFGSINAVKTDFIVIVKEMGFTADVGGALFLEFDEDGNLLLNVTRDEEDFLFDEIGSGLKVKQIQQEKRELLESLELYYRTFYLGEEFDE